MSRIKICGLSRPEDIMAVNRSLPDYAGFVFAPSKRFVTHQTAALLKRMLSPQIKAAGVFVNAPEEQILALSDEGIIDAIQLHGDESADYIGKLKSKTNLPVIKAIRVRRTEDIVEGNKLPCDFLLLDTYHKDLYGGSGVTFDWNLIPPLTKPFFLAGGVKEENLVQAAHSGAYCLDLSSSVETDGHKDAGKIQNIISKIRSISICQKENLEYTEGSLCRKP